jgi:hypothetical protein
VPNRSSESDAFDRTGKKNHTHQKMGVIGNYRAAKSMLSCRPKFCWHCQLNFGFVPHTTSLLKLDIRQDVDSGELSRPTYSVFLVLRTALHQQLWLSLDTRSRFYSLESTSSLLTKSPTLSNSLMPDSGSVLVNTA